MLDHIVVDLPGGFGNQLFGFAMGYAVSKELGCGLWIDTTFQDQGITWKYELDNLNIFYDKRLSYKWTRKIWDRVIFNKIRRKNNVGWTIDTYLEDKSLSYDNRVFQIYKNTYFKGNWENEAYFEKYRVDIQNMFTCKSERNSAVRKLENEILDENNISVGLHVRRGDKAQIGCTLDSEYYNNAIKKMREILEVEQGTLNIYVVSDDIKWCKENIKTTEKLCYLEYESDDKAFDDWLLYKDCKHHIIGNSTFSWWAAWLKDEKNHYVIIPSDDMKYNSLKKENWIVL